jgi:hypothetical protein
MRGAEEYEGPVQLCSGGDAALANATARILVAGSIDGAASWRGTLEGISPPDVTLGAGEYRLLLPGGTEGDILIRQAYVNSGDGCEFEGVGEPPQLL